MKKTLLLCILLVLLTLGLASCTGTPDTATGTGTGTPATSAATTTTHVHTEVIDAAVPATCTTPGLTEGSHCSACGEIIKPQATLLATGHTPVTDLGKAPTCTEEGLSDGSHCGVCREVLVASAPLNPLGHSPVPDGAVAPTCTQTGLTAGSHCFVCHITLVAQEAIPATGHTPVTDPAKAPSCESVGLTAGEHCSVCHAVLTAQEGIPALGHTPVTDAAVAPTCTKPGRTEGSHCSVCSTVLVAQTVLDALSHTQVTDDAVAPTCTQTGLTKGVHCFVCNETLVEQTVIPALGHTPVTEGAVAPTCTAPGNSGSSHCSVCREILSTPQALPATGHTAVTDAATAPTCTQPGLTEGSHCSVCKAVLVTQTTLPSTGHTPVADGAVTPTCTEAGLSAGSHCSVCEAVLVEQTVLPALGHHFSTAWTVDVIPTADVPGSKSHHCTRCDEKTDITPIPFGQYFPASLYSGTPDDSWYTGSATEYTLSSADQLMGFFHLRAEGTDFAGITVKLACDVVFNEGGAAEIAALSSPHHCPVYGSGSLFKGIFDGGDHTVSGVYQKANSAGVIGLFGAMGDNAVIKNLILQSVCFSGPTADKNTYGIIASQINGKNVLFSGIHVTDALLTKDTGDMSKIGGLVGRLFAADCSLTVENCSTAGVIDFADCNEIGGLVGSVDNATATLTIRNSSSTMTITGGDYIGGLVGNNKGTADIDASSFSGTITATGIHRAALVGSDATTDPVDPPVTDPVDPPVTDPVDPPVTDPVDPPVTDPVDPPVTDPVTTVPQENTPYLLKATINAGDVYLNGAVASKLFTAVDNTSQAMTMMVEKVENSTKNEYYIYFTDGTTTIYLAWTSSGGTSACAVSDTKTDNCIWIVDADKKAIYSESLNRFIGIKVASTELEMRTYSMTNINGKEYTAAWFEPVA